MTKTLAAAVTFFLALGVGLGVATNEESKPAPLPAYSFGEDYEEDAARFKWTREEVLNGTYAEAMQAQRLERVKAWGKLPGVTILEPCYEDHDCATVDHGFPGNWEIIPMGPGKEKK